MVWIDYQKAYGKNPQPWKIESLNITGSAKNAVKVLGKTMDSWRVELTCDAETLVELLIKRKIFLQLFVIALIPMTRILRTANPEYELGTGEIINNQLFMDNLKMYSKRESVLDCFIQTVRIFREDNGIKFWIDKGDMLMMKNMKIVKSDGSELPNEKVIKLLEERESCKYLGLLEADELMVNKIKDKVKKSIIEE